MMLPIGIVLDAVIATTALCHADMRIIATACKRGLPRVHTCGISNLLFLFYTDQNPQSYSQKIGRKETQR